MESKDSKLHVKMLLMIEKLKKLNNFSANAKPFEKSSRRRWHEGANFRAVL